MYHQRPSIFVLQCNKISFHIILFVISIIQFYIVYDLIKTEKITIYCWFFSFCVYTITQSQWTFWRILKLLCNFHLLLNNECYLRNIERKNINNCNRIYNLFVIINFFLVSKLCLYNIIGKPVYIRTSKFIGNQPNECECVKVSDLT